ncbi:FAD-dependent monooxygenase [Photobacterium galatheae]|uniref:FAD-binding domain-containing protein n=1 Tax=Photobacterium galatheae TaxID=1654360 RepID=A0A066RQG5_9GAMM|nr:FAD-dependent monooxygenase [Photobacterium galatheae]KDM92660.1 hypothetical protein EA58_04600 [Photobacterium galatheae]MCM0149421.1 FAD-dependent monooxygenase [Photobacterium galatheae]
MTQIIQTQIAVIGAGVGGCIAALALSRHFDVVLIDQHPECPPKVGECLPPAAGRILRELGLLDAFQQHQTIHLPCHGIRSRWGSKTCFINDNLNNPDGLGWQLDRAGFENWLRQQVVARNVRCLWPARPVAVQQGRDGWLLQLQGTGTQQRYALPCHFVIDASGRRSAFAAMLGIRRQAFDKQVALWASRDGQRDDLHHDLLATLSACEYGWWYSARLPGQRRVLALQTDADLPEHGLHLNAERFFQMAMAQKEIASLITSSSVAQQHWQLHGKTSANTTRLKQYAGFRWAAIGDAACSFNPLSSQGMFNAMATAMQLADQLTHTALDDPQALAALSHTHSEQITSVWQHYLDHHQHYYLQEQRWPDKPYWQRRHQSLSLET